MSPRPMAHEQALLEELASIWRQTAPDMRPYGLWISLHEPVEIHAHQASTNIIRVWYLDESGIHERSETELSDFLKTARESDVFNSRPGRIHKVGTASFAPLKNSDMFYLDYMFGGTYGRGFHCSVNDEGRVHYENKRLWVS